ncbi:cytidyltransferase-related domain protein [Pseudoflavonifractor sp. 60]|uniref:nicotinate-nicotinamide nucleotide adenylyltransferase n=1 Tax=Pseudoflavonifractor sp. 60 TaxID=2304576 RepID=UPI001371844A|nr:cytidyltransferase-related domain protein [Pseudoflavonifractor sp. 60]NBI68124.1 cytidyltransferase-related domain protein [Pseudoflavonifractor sp. 60]
MYKMTRQLNRDIYDALNARKLIGPVVGRRAVQELMKSEGWNRGLSDLFPIRERITCARVLELCSPMLDKLCPQPPEKGWGPFCYQYICRIMFPDNGFAPEAPRCGGGALFYLTVLQVLLYQERASLPLDPFWNFDFLSEEEYSKCDKGKEYRRFREAWHNEFIYPLMRLGMEYTPFRTLSHITGVHHVAMTCARGLAEAGVDVDLALISAAAAAHDLGKFGCRPGERVPYLHYYYTDQWLLARKMDDISHIASNHSTWDLELESLSVESLLLIYADFRSKSERGPNGEEIVVLYPLEESFQVILSKLDNVDRKKRRRYELVYGKLHDFEDYMRRLGVDVGLTGEGQTPAPPKDPALMGPDETLDGLILLSVEHSLKLMHMLSNEQKFGNIIESARSAKSWQQLRAYLNIFEEYFTYLSVRQKTQALSFLYELLVHREGDIRRQAGALIGQIIAKFHLVYRKEVPADAQNDPAEEVPFTLWNQYLDMIIFPDHKTTPQQRAHIGYCLKLMVEAMLLHARLGDVSRFLDALLRYYQDPEHTDADTAFTLLDTAHHLPPKYYDERTREMLVDFAAHFTASDDPKLVTAALQFLRETVRNIPRSSPQMARIAQIAQNTPSGQLTTVFLKCRILRRAGWDVSALEDTLYQSDITSEVFLDNLKIATPWVVKVAGVELLRDQVEHGMKSHILHIATHFSNLVKVSERVGVRHAAGSALVHTLSLLRRDQRNEVVVELGKGLEMGQYEISKYIPQYLGEAALYLHPSELDEQVLWLKGLLGSPNDSAVAGALNTIAVLLQHYPAYKDRFPEKPEVYEHRRRELLGLLLQGLAHYREEVRQEALLVIGKHLFESSALDDEEKARLFALCYRKLLFLMRETPRQDGLTLFYRASALAHINRFISLRRLDHGPFAFERPKKIAFFPGTFDPFTLSHKGIVHAIRDLGFEVYLAVDEFSWSKKAQPHLIRRQIVNLSIAGDFHVHLFPDDIPVNIANPADLKRLVELFPDQKVYIVAGSDVVVNASSYRAPAQPWSIHQMNHVIFHRAGEQELPEHLSITGDVIRLQLPPHLEDISSTRIRENVDLNRDISNFIDPVIQDFIYQNGLYLRDGQDKPMLGFGELDFRWVEEVDDGLFRTLAAIWPERAGGLTAARSKGDRMLILTATSDAVPLGFVCYRLLTASQLFEALEDNELADRIRLRSAGNVLLITALGTDYSTAQRKDLGHLLLCELIAWALEQECVYCVCRTRSGQLEPSMDALLARMGFTAREGDAPIREVDMRAPTVLIQNLSTAVQEPLNRNPRVLAAVRRGHERVQLALAGLFPGSLVLTLSSDVIHHRLLKKITEYNNVPAEPTSPRVLGKSMCVPFGKMLRSRIVPNTVTKTLHTDKVYSPDLKESTLEAFPYYAPIPSQVRTLKSFNRPVILVDDLMHPGFRFKVLGPILKQEGVPVQVVLVGVLSGYGKDLMNTLEQPVDSVYFLPRLNHWFVESTMYPFIGGNTVRRRTSPVPGLLPGINHILPYAAPTYQNECSREAVVNLSRTCLECALDLMRALEQEYRTLYGRNLTLSRLPEAVILPLCPDKGTCLHYDPNLSASVYLENDLEQLLRQNS